MLFVVVMALYLSIQSYILWRYYQMLPQYRTVRILGAIGALLLTISMPLVMLLGRMLPGEIVRPLYLMGATWMVGLIYFLIPVLSLDLFRLLNRFGRWIAPEKIEAFRLGNGKLFLTLALFYLIFFTIGNRVYEEKARREYFFNLENLQVIDETACRLPEKGGEIDSIHPIKIIMISDLHLGHTIQGAELKRWVEMLNAEEADYLLIAGDLIDNDLRPLYAGKMEQILAKLSVSKGIYAVLGNHEYIAGVEQSIPFFAKSGVTLLRDEVVLLPEGLILMGRDDKMNRERATLSSLLEVVDEIDPAAPLIILDHQPGDITGTLASRREKGPFLQLSGHTHDGQVWPYMYATDYLHQISSGLTSFGEDHFLISSGLGVWGGKFRIGTRSEYVVINFCFEDESLEETAK
ncbi:hypothetical protein B9T19_03275 [Ignatzschineria sp. F8392]|uniref:metallophosphoesterase n=1 Tax=Ignatzschineria sp. F8392 TaxID=1980117 RepID=UPI000B986EE4|nr:metallophosphoesterase [Ignatzschineria sp. F8392]OYQ81697.1 hypothetical protein B9T19_03275 [Ignatzschineria sp. F8392]